MVDDHPGPGSTDAIRRVTLAELPARNERNVAVRLTPAGERALRSDHPWIFTESIADQSHEGSPGDLAIIFDRRRDFAAVGLYDPTSPIRVRVLQRRRPTTIDRTFWVRRLHQARDRRAGLTTDGRTTGYRLVNGEGDRMSGLVADLYEGTVVLKLYSPAWTPHLRDVLAALVEVIDPTAVVVRLSRSMTALDPAPLVDGALVEGTLSSARVAFREDGLSFEADVQHGPKTGHFCDQRENRRAIRDLGATTVLDVFSSTGGFTLAAAAGGATHVDAIDQSRPALRALRANLERNRDDAAVAACEVTTIEGDAFERMAERRRAGARYDLVIVDPPSFAHRAADARRAATRYTELAGLGASLVEPGGTLFQASCSSRVDAGMLETAVLRGVGDAGRIASVRRRSGHAVDHPVRHPEGEYLHAVTIEVD